MARGVEIVSRLGALDPAPARGLLVRSRSATVVPGIRLAPLPEHGLKDFRAARAAKRCPSVAMRQYDTAPAPTRPLNV